MLPHTRPHLSCLHLLITLALAMLTGCSDDAAAPVICDPGIVQACPCPGGAQGAQRCGDQGTIWEACVCPNMPVTRDMSHTPDMPVTSTDMGHIHAPDMPVTTTDMGYTPDMSHTPDMTVPKPSCVTAATEEVARAEGQQLFAQYCAACHGTRGQGNAVGPGLWEEVAEEPDHELIEVMQEGDDDMPPTAATEAQARLIIGYLLWEAAREGYRADAERCEDEKRGH